MQLNEANSRLSQAIEADISRRISVAAADEGSGVQAPKEIAVEGVKVQVRDGSSPEIRLSRQSAPEAAEEEEGVTRSMQRPTLGERSMSGVL